MRVGSSDEGRRSSQIPGWLVVVGGVPLLTAMAVEFVSIIGRHTGVTFVGSIELVQAAVLVSSSAAIVIATLSRAHAKVRIVLSRARGRPGRALRLFNALGSAVFFLALSVGSAWIAMDMWGALERSELLGIPYLPLRCFATACMLASAILYTGRIITGIARR